MKFTKKIIRLTRYDYQKILRTGIHQIVFEKKDGSYRELIGTLQESLIPVTLKEKAKELLDVPTKTINENVVSVYDLVKQEWRSFRLDSIISIKKAKLSNSFQD